MDTVGGYSIIYFVLLVVFGAYFVVRLVVNMNPS